MRTLDEISDDRLALGACTVFASHWSTGRAIGRG